MTNTIQSNMRNKLSKYFYNTIELNSDITIITPIKTFVEKLCKYHSIKNKFKKWWHGISLTIEGKSINILYFYPGSFIHNVFDCIKTKSILMLGFCGSFDDKKNIGDIVMPKIAKIDSRLDVYSERKDMSGIIYTTTHMITNKYKLQEIVKTKAKFVDMETYYLYKFGQTYNISTKSVLIISDFPLKQAFYKLDNSDYKVINRQINNISINISQYL